MRRSARVRRTAIATLVGTAAALAPPLHQGSGVRAQEGFPHGRVTPADVAKMQGPALLAEESGTPPRGQRLRAIVARALSRAKV